MRWSLQISAGTGPLEVREFVALLARELASRCVAAGALVESVCIYGDDSAPRSVTLHGEGGEGAELRSWEGTHLLVAASAHRGRRSRKRWFVGVRVLPAPPAEEVEVTLDDKDLTVTAMRAGGPGGQHVNTSDSAVRVVHGPSGMSVRVASERSQHQNRRVALRRLAAMLVARERENGASHRRESRRAHYSIERGNPVCRWRLDARSGALVKEDRCRPNA